MATFSFSTVTDVQALGITSADILIMDRATGNSTTVLFIAADRTTIVAGDRTVVFGVDVAQATKIYPDGGALIIGGAGNDQRSAGTGNDGLYGALGDDTLAAASGNDLLQGNMGDDSLNGGVGSDVIYGGQGNDLIDTGTGAAEFAQGNRGADTLQGGGADADTLLGGQENDLINATGTRSSPDFFAGLDPINFRSGAGGDFLNGNLGNDTIFGGVGADRIFGEDGNDYLQDFGGQNAIDGGAGNDTIVAAGVGTGFANTISAGSGDDTLTVGGSSTVDAGSGNDRVFLQVTPPQELGARTLILLGDGNDYTTVTGPSLRLASDSFTIDGGLGDDHLFAGAGRDSIAGGDGNDTLTGGGGSDTMAGGTGSDQFKYIFEQFVAQGADVITDWSSIDRFYFQSTLQGTTGNYIESARFTYDEALNFANAQISSGFDDYVAVEVGSDVYVFANSFGANEPADVIVRLVGRSLADISHLNFDATTRFETF